MKYIQLGIFLTDDLGLKEVHIQHNETDLPCDSVLLTNVAWTLIKSISMNAEDVNIQDLLNEFDIRRAKE